MVPNKPSLNHKKSWWHTKGFWVGFVLVCLVFFLGTLLLPFASSGRLFVSPDETANAFFAQHFSQFGTLRVSDPLTAQFDDALFPRSVVAINGELLPQSFVGLPVIYGLFAYFFGPFILWILTPLLVLCTAFALRSLLREWFSSRVADLSAVLFLIHPAVWYYSARGLMHNVLFICLLILGVFVFVRRPLAYHLERCVKRVGKLQTFQLHMDDLVAGGLIGLSLFVRASEIYWVGTLLFVFVVRSLRKDWKRVLRLLFGIFLGLLPFFLMNLVTYGHPLVTGYTVERATQEVVSSVGQDLPISQSIFPFGINLHATASHVADYGLLLFWWLSALALIGFFVVASRQRWYALVFCGVTIWLGVWYGSWVLFDNPDPTQITIANSYIRYWLPVYVLSIPFIAEGVRWVIARARSGSARVLALMALLIFITALNVRLVFFEGQDALIRSAHNLREAVETNKDVISLTASQSVIIVDRADKLFFPDRHVLYPLRSDTTYDLMPSLAAQVSLYYFGITFPSTDMDYLNQKKLPPLGLQIEWIKTYGEESLYEIKMRPPVL